jgi:hypothetical protein
MCLIRPIQTAPESARAKITAQVSSENFRDGAFELLVARGVDVIVSDILLAPCCWLFVTCLRNFGVQKQKARLTACAVGGLEIRL